MSGKKNNSQNSFELSQGANLALLMTEMGMSNSERDRKQREEAAIQQEMLWRKAHEDAKRMSLGGGGGGSISACAGTLAAQASANAEHLASLVQTAYGGGGGASSGGLPAGREAAHALSAASNVLQQASFVVGAASGGGQNSVNVRELMARMQKLEERAEKAEGQVEELAHALVAAQHSGPAASSAALLKL